MKRLSADAWDLPKLWKSMLKLLRRDKVISCHQQSMLTADSFARFFDEKIKAILADTEGIPLLTSPNAASTTLSGFQECSVSAV
jgi:hypothetical protein